MSKTQCELLETVLKQMNKNIQAKDVVIVKIEHANENLQGAMLELQSKVKELDSRIQTLESANKKLIEEREKRAELDAWNEEEKILADVMFKFQNALGWFFFGDKKKEPHTQNANAVFITNT